MSNLVYDGQIDGDFEGFNNDTLFKMPNGTYWVQTQYQYWYHYAYSPHVTITQEDGRYMLNIDDNSVPVRRATDVVKSKINGEFTGWEGNTRYELLNGQVWEQSRYMYKYKYAYMPDAIVYRTDSGYKMMVAKIIADVRRVH